MNTPPLIDFNAAYLKKREHEMNDFVPNFGSSENEKIANGAEVT